MLLGRGTECAALLRLLQRARAGQSGVLVLRGEPGIGKSALLDYTVRAAVGFMITRAGGVQSEIEVAFAALHQVCLPFMDRVDQLPEPQRDAVRIALGLSSGGAPNRLLVGLAILNLLSDAARGRPLLCVIDDAQWLDRGSAQALAFVARRLEADSVAILFGRRLASGHDEIDGLPDLLLQGLAPPDAQKLFETAFPLSLDRDVADRILDEARGNPLAILELPRSVAPAAMAGGFGPFGLPLAGRLEETFQQRVERLPADTQLMLLIAAAEPLGDPVLLWRAAAEVGLGLEAIAAAEANSLLTVGSHVAFRHPIVRSVVYESATPANRRHVHRALAAATDAVLDPDRAAWHRAHAVLGPDESLAEELGRCAERAQARGGLFASAAFLERAVQLTIDPVRRAERALAAAKDNELAGAANAALRLLHVAEAGPLDERLRAEADHVRAEVAFATNRGSDAARLLLKAARRMEPLDVVRARVTYLEALCAALFAAGFTTDGDAVEVARAARAAPSTPDPEDGADFLLSGMTALIIEGEAVAAPALRRALNAFALGEVSLEAQMRWGWLACRVAPLLWDDAIWPVVTGRAARVARVGGSIPAIAAVTPSAMAMHVFAGEMVAAQALAQDAPLIAQSSGIPPMPYGLVVIAAWRGHEREAADVIEASISGLMQRGEGMGVALVHWARALLHNSRGRYREALSEAEAASAYPPGMLYSGWGLVELIEAAARCGNPRRGAAALDRLAESTQASGTEWALGIEARSRSLLSTDDVAEDCYREAIERLERTRIRAETARAHLLFGEWLRRQRRRTAAREHLRIAAEMFESMDAAAFANRARVELLATGEHARKRTELPGADLSPQESRIALMASDGMSDIEIASQLFISASTVDYHLRKVFRKLGVNSRARLHLVLQQRSAPAAG